MTDLQNQTNETAGRMADATKRAADQGAQMTREGMDTMRQGAERMQSAGNEAFQQTVDRSLTALNDMNGAYKRNLEAMVASVTAATKGAEALGAQAMSYSKTSMEEGVQAARALSSARSVQEVVELQTSYARKATEAYMAELNRWSETVQSSFNDSVKPLNERVTAAVEQAQSQR